MNNLGMKTTECLNRYFRTILCLSILISWGGLAAQRPTLVVPIGHTIGGFGSFTTHPSPDGRWILIADGSKIAKLWNQEGRMVVNFEMKEDIKNIAFSPDSKTILLINGDRAALWDINGRHIRDFVPDAYALDTGDFSPDGQSIVLVAEEAGFSYEL